MSLGVRIEKPEHSEIVFKGLRFLITDRPSDATLDSYVDELRKRSCNDVVRVCEPSYSTEKLAQAGIQVHDLHFEDGSPPTNEIMERWFDVVRSRFGSAHNGTDKAAAATTDSCIAVHCVAGLGRAPVLVALALIEKGMKYEDAVCAIREKRHKAINAKQLEFLRRYKPVGYLKSGRLNTLFSGSKRKNTTTTAPNTLNHANERDDAQPTLNGSAANRLADAPDSKRKGCVVM